MGEQTGICHSVRSAIGLLRSNLMYDHERRALLDALGHGDCVPREEGNDVAFSQLKRAGELTARAERAERERDALRADAERYRELCREWSAALSADADADAEPSGEQHRPGCAFGSGWPKREVGGDPLCICEPSRAEGDEPEWPDCHTCNDTGHFWLGDNEYVCEDCSTALAEGGRPGEGDDGYCRAVQAAIRRLVDRRESGGRDNLDAVERAMLHADASGAVDAALASGGVVEIERAAEVVDHDCAETHQQIAGWATESARDAEDRVRELEAALREIRDESAVHDPFGTLPPDSEWVRAARAEQARQRRRAARVLGDSDA